MDKESHNVHVDLPVNVEESKVRVEFSAQERPMEKREGGPQEGPVEVGLVQPPASASAGASGSPELKDQASELRKEGVRPCPRSPRSRDSWRDRLTQISRGASEGGSVEDASRAANPGFNKSDAYQTRLGTMALSEYDGPGELQHLSVDVTREQLPSSEETKEGESGPAEESAGGTGAVHVKEVRFDLDAVETILVSAETESETETEEGGWGRRGGAALPPDGSRGPAALSELEDYVPPPVPLDEVELRRVRSLTASRSPSDKSPHSSRHNSARSGDLNLDEETVVVSSGPEAESDLKLEPKEEVHAAPHESLAGLRLSDAPPSQPESKDTRPLPGTIEPPGRHERFTQAPLDQIEKETREWEERRKLETKEASARQHERQVGEKKVAEIKDVFFEAGETFHSIMEKHWETYTLKATTLGIQAENARLFLKSIRDAKGLAFLTHRKRGLILTADVGTGFVAVKQADGGWSGPSIVDIRGLSLGASAGSAWTRSLVFLHNEEDINKLKEGKSQVQLAGSLSMTASGEKAEAGLSTSTATSGSGANRIFSVSEGSLVDLSISGAQVHHDGERNEILWGRSISPQEILSGNVEPLPVLTDLLKLMNDWIQAKENMNVGNVDLGAQGSEHVAPQPEPFYKVLM